MEIKWFTGCLYVCVFFTVLAESLASSFFSKHHSKYQQNHKTQQTKTNNFLEKSCDCRVELADGSLIMNFGKVAHYTKEDGSCHALHHKCRLTCTGHLNLHSYMPGSTTTLGYHYCDIHGKTTDNLGVQVRAVWETVNCHQKKHQKSRKMSRLCCGHTSLPLTSDRHQVVAKVFGWNPDCKAQTFIVAS